MANQIPLSGLSDAAGGILLPEEQGGMLTAGVLQLSGAFSVAGDARATGSRRTSFTIWNGAPTASMVGEGGTKPVTGAEFAGGTLNVKKAASIVLFTDEQIEDVQGGDLNVLVDSGVREAIADVLDANAIGMDSGAAFGGSIRFDSELVGTTSTVAVGTAQDGLQKAVSAAMGTLEQNGYSDFGALLGSDVQRYIRDARGGTAETALYGGAVADPFYGIPRSYSTNLRTLAAGGTVGFVVARNNLHVRIRKDVTLSRSNEATVGGTSLWQNDLTGVRYVTRVGFWIHDKNRAVVAITK